MSNRVINDLFSGGFEMSSNRIWNGDRPISKLPSGFGAIRYLGEGRAKPYAVHPPMVKGTDGKYYRPAPLCYVTSWYVGFAVLMAYHAGHYEAGMEKDFEPLLRKDLEINGVGLVAKAICKDYCTIRKRSLHGNDDLTVAEVYERLYDQKFGQMAPFRLSRSRQLQMNAAFKLLEEIHDCTLDELSIQQLQDLVNRIASAERAEAAPHANGAGKRLREDGSGKKLREDGSGKKRIADGTGRSYSTVRNVVTLIKDLYRFALPRELCTKQYGLYVVMPRTREVVHHGAFTDEDLKCLWAHRDNPVVKNILGMCYSGFRISAYPKLEVNLDEGFFKGGVKTAAGRGRMVPIHSCLRPLLEDLRDGEEVRFLCGKSAQQFRRDMVKGLVGLGLRPLTPHSCRHTFNRLLERAGVPEADRKRLMGHSLKGDLLNGTYGHRSLEELREQVEKI